MTERTLFIVFSVTASLINTILENFVNTIPVRYEQLKLTSKLGY